MALSETTEKASKSLEKAQTPALCQFCEESTEIKWRCINCELYLCNLCRSKIHSKSKASKEHQIIDLIDYNQSEELAQKMRIVNIQNMQCTTHCEKKCIMYCQDCSEPVCSKCMSEVHPKHTFNSLDEVYEGLIADIKKQEDKIESSLKFFKKEKDKLQKKLSKGDKNFKETKEIILQTEKEMKDAISKHTKDFLQELDAKWKPSENMIKTELTAIKKNEDDLESRRTNLNQALQSHQASDIFSTNKTLDESLPENAVSQIEQYEAKFIPNNRQKKIGSQMLGDLYTVPDFELIDTYQSNAERLPCILVSGDNTAFIGSNLNKKIQKIKFENHCIKLEEEVQIAAFDMTWTKDGEILVSSTESDLKLYTKDGKLKTFKSFSPLKTLGVHVTKDNKLIVGLAESFALPAPKDSIRKLEVMNQNGDTQHTIYHDKDNQRLLTYPHQIDSFNDKIVVIDLINKEWEGRVVMLDYGGKLHWTYKGCKSINSDKVGFSPKDLAITSTKLILLSDCSNQALHVISPTGEVIVCKDVKTQLGIMSPLSLYVTTDVLWIGCHVLEENKKDRSNAKLTCFKLL